jgi:hypothetical protein
VSAIRASQPFAHAKMNDHQVPGSHSWRKARSPFFIGAPVLLIGSVFGTAIDYALLEDQGVTVPLTLWLAHPIYYEWWPWSIGGALIGGTFDLAARLLGRDTS